MAHDIDTIPERWPFTCIDWAHTYQELRFGGDVYDIDAGEGGIHIFRSI